MSNSKTNFSPKIFHALLGALLLTLQVCLVYRALVWLKLDHQIWGRFESGHGFRELCIFTAVFTVPLGVALGFLASCSRPAQITGSWLIFGVALLLLINSFHSWNQTDTYFVFVPLSGLTIFWSAMIIMRRWQFAWPMMATSIVSLLMITTLTAYLLTPRGYGSVPSTLKQISSALKADDSKRKENRTHGTKETP